MNYLHFRQTSLDLTKLLTSSLQADDTHEYVCKKILHSFSLVDFMIFMGPIICYYFVEIQK